MPNNLILCRLVARYVHSTESELPALRNLEHNVSNVARAALHKFRSLHYQRIHIAVLAVELENLLGVQFSLLIRVNPPRL